MDYKLLIDSMKRFGSTNEDICVYGLGVRPDQINEHVVLAPCWEPSVLPGLGNAQFIDSSTYSSIKVWNISSSHKNITYIKTGIGAPVLMDALLALGVTRCRQIIFIGSVGALDKQIGIGDIVIPEYSICGDGASRYLTNGALGEKDVFGEKVYPDLQLMNNIKQVTDSVCKKHSVAWHAGRNFSTDTVFAQFAHIDTILNMGCNVIEMETAAAFRAAKMAGIAIGAIFSVSDNTLVNKSLISGRKTEEMEYRKFVRRELFPEIILGLFK